MTTTLEAAAVSSMNYFFLRTITGKPIDAKVESELGTFLERLQRQQKHLAPDIEKEIRDELDLGGYFFGKSRKEIMTLLDQGIIKIRGEAMPEVTNFYMRILPERFNTK